MLDGLALVREYAQYSKEVNQKYLCITDHGVMGAVPQQIAESEEHNLSPIFGIEAYINRLQPKSDCREDSAEYRKTLSEEDQKRFDKSNHLLLLAYNDIGYRNLVRLSSWAWRYGFYKKPRINWEVLMENREGLIATSTCANSEIANAFLRNMDDQEGFDVVEQYMAAFGDKFYLELMMLDFKLQKPYDAFLLRAHAKYSVPLIMSQDCHYCFRKNSKHQRLMLMMQNKRTIQEIELLKATGADLFELQDENLWMKSEPELNQKWESDYQDIIDYDLYKQSKENTVKICEMAKGVQIDRSIKLPKMDDENKILRQLIMEGVEDRGIPKTKVYLDRIKEEYELITKKGFSSYFLIQKMMVEEAQRICPELLGYGDGSEAVGPGRGSCCGSLLAYSLGLHDVDPIEHDLLFSRFLSPARGGKTMKIRFSQKPINIDMKVEKIEAESARELTGQI